MLHDKNSLDIRSIADSMMFNPAFPVGTEKVKSEGVFVRIVYVQQGGFQAFPFRRVYITLENWLLNAKAVI